MEEPPESIPKPRLARSLTFQMIILHAGLWPDTSAGPLPSMMLSRLGIKIAALEGQLGSALAERDAAVQRSEESNQVITGCDEHTCLCV